MQDQNEGGPTPPTKPSLSRGVEFAIYAIGAFGNSANLVVAVIIPFWAIAIGASPIMIGIIVGARYFLTTLLSIHGGVIIDRIGTRRVLVAFGIVAVLVPLLFPVMPTIWAAIVLQMVGGLASNYGTIGSQALFGDLMKGSTIYAGRFAFGLRVGQLVAPPLAGFVWDIGGPWAGFGLLSLWGVGLLACSMALPKTIKDTSHVQISVMDVLPRPSDYIETLRMLALPAVLFTFIMTGLRIGGQGMQGSFYIVYLEGLGYSGSLIGLLVGAASITGFAGALSITALTRVIAAQWLLISSVAITIICVMITPLLAGVSALLLLAMVIRGAGMGLSQPLMMTILARAAGDGNQGKGVGLRTTGNRLSSMVVPIIMGAVVEWAGIVASFYIVGAGLLIMTLLTIGIARRSRAQERDA